MGTNRRTLVEELEDRPDSRVTRPGGESLAEQLRCAITNSELSVYRVAIETGVDQSTLNKFVNGDRNNLRLDVADRLFRFFFHPPRLKSKRRLGAIHPSRRDR